MDGNQRQPDCATTGDDETSPTPGIILHAVMQDACTAMLLTDLDGVICRLAVTDEDFPNNAPDSLTGRSILCPFAAEEHAFLKSLVQKAHHTDHFEIERIPVRLDVTDPCIAFMSVTAIEGSEPGDALLSWRLSTRDHTPKDRDGAEQALSQRIEKRYESQLAADEARRSAEEGRYRLGFLSEASRTLSASLDFNTTVEQAARLAVPHVSECCIVDLLDHDGDTLRRAVVVCDALGLSDRINAKPEYDFTDDDSSHPLLRPLRTGKSVVVEDMAEFAAEFGIETQHDSKHSTEVGFSYGIVTALRSRDRVFGAMTFVSTDAHRPYHPDDLLLAEELAFRASQALDNATLYQQAEEASKTRERYLSIASHELRSPLTVVSGFGALLLKQLSAPELDYERVAMLGRELQRGIERLEILTDGLLVSSTLHERGNEPTVSRVDLIELVEALLTNITSTSDMIDGHIVTLDAPTSVIGFWNRESIERALFNIISNAVKYSPDGGNVRVEIAMQDGLAVVRVSDEGIGMSVEDQAELFSPFVRGRSARATAQGTGLGLYITKQIVDQHHGEIEVQSTPGAGSTFTVRVPLKAVLPG